MFFGVRSCLGFQAAVYVCVYTRVLRALLHITLPPIILCYLRQRLPLPKLVGLETLQLQLLQMRSHGFVTALL